MLCPSEPSNVDNTATLTAKTHRPKNATNNKKVEEMSLPTTSTKAAELARKLLSRGGGDSSANDILNREIPKIKVNNTNKSLIVLLCEKNSQPFETRVISLVPQKQCVIGRASSKSRPCDTNGYFDCKVISRNQACVWCDDEGRFWIKDTQSSNGTYVNGSKLNDEASELHSGDVIQLGLTVYENKCSDIHNCIIAAVQLYLPKGTTADEGACGMQQQHVIEEVHEPTDLCETSRTTVCEAEKSERPKRLSMDSRATSAARSVSVNSKHANADEAVRNDILSIQSFIEAIQNNSAEAWESISKEDNHLQRIHTLQNKIRVLKNDMTDEELQVEKQVWEKDKLLHKCTAKDAIRRFDLETKEITLKFEQIDMKFRNSEHKCDSMRDQIDSKQQAINDFLCLLRHIEIDYDEYKTEMQAKMNKLNNELNKKVNDLIENLRKINLEHADLRRKFEQMQVLEKELNEEERCESAIEKPETESMSRQNFKTILAKFEQIGLKLKVLEKEEISVEILNLFEFKQAFIDVVKQYNELLEGNCIFEPTGLQEEVASYESESLKSVSIAGGNMKPELKEACEQTNDETFDYEAEIDELQTQLIDKSLEADYMQNKLENERDLYRKKCLELQQENENLLAKQQMEIVQQKEKETHEKILNDLKAEYSIQMQQQKSNLSDMERELATCKNLLNESQAKTQSLENELENLAAQHQLVQNGVCLLPILVPMFMGLVGILIYLLIGFSL